MSLFRVYVDGALFYHPQMSKLAITAARIEEACTRMRKTGEAEGYFLR